MADIGTAYVKVAPNMTGIQGKVAAGFKGTGTKVANQMGGEISGRSAAIVGAIAGVASAAASKAMNMIASSIGGAIKRVDTLNNAGRTFEYMGFQAQDAAKATAALNKSILGLPTPLDSAMRGMTALAATYQDIGLGQKVFSSLNNAILGFGGTAAQVENAITQLSQLPLDGPLDAQTWNSLRNSGLTPLLVAMAKESGMSVSAMKEAFGEGELTVGDFTNKLIEMNTKGGGGLAALETIAKSATSGIGTGMANMQTAVSRGVANIIQAIGASNIADAIGKIGASFEKALNVVAQNVPKAIRAIAQLSDFVVRNKDVIIALAVGITAAVVALKAYSAAMAVSRGITVAYTAVTTYLNLVQSLQAQGLGTLRAAWFALNTVMKANPIGIITTALVALTAGLTYFFTQTETGRAIFENAWGKMKDAVGFVVDAFNIAKTAVTEFISGAVDKLSDAISSGINWLNDWRAWFINIGIVIGTILLPRLLQLGGQFVATAVKAAVSAVKAGAAWVKQAALATGAWLKNLPKVAAQAVKTAASSAKQAIIAGAAWIKQSVLTAASWVKTFALYGLGVAKAALQTGIAAVKMAASWLLALGPIGLIIAAVAGAAALIIANWNSVSTFVVGVWHGIQNAVQVAIEWIKANWPLILAILTGPIGLAVLAIVKNWDTIKNAFSSAWNFIKSIWGGVGEWFKGIWNGIKGAFSSVSSWFRDTFNAGWNNIKNVFSGIGGWFKDRFNDIKNAFSGIYNIGVDVVKGLWHGISSMGNWLKDKLIGFVKDKIPGPVKKALGISSPSKVFASFGRDINRGLAQGIEKNTGMVASAVDSLTDSTLAGLTNPLISPSAMGDVSSAAGQLANGSSTTNQSVSIQQVVLASDSAVKEFFRQLNQDTINVGMGITPNQGLTP